MSGGWAILGLGLFVMAALFWLWAKTSDYQEGRIAQRNGLALNPRWSKAMREGWADEFGASIERKLAADLAESGRKLS